MNDLWAAFNHWENMEEMKMRSIYFLLLTFSLLVFSLYTAALAGVDEFLNSNVVVTRSGGSVTLNNIALGENTYWATWTIDDMLQFNLTSYGVLDDNSAFNIGKACGALSDRSPVDASAQDLEYFSHVKTGCLIYYARPYYGGTQYCCEGSNFFRVLGNVYEDKVVEMTGFEIPLYLPPGSTFSGKIESRNVDTDATSTMYFSISIFDDPDNNAWIEHFSLVSENSHSTFFRRFRKVSYEILESKAATESWQ